MCTNIRDTSTLGNSAKRNMGRRLRFLFLCSLLPILVWSGVVFTEWYQERNEMERKLGRIRAEQTNELTNPNPRFLGLLLQDRECAERVQSVVFLNEMESCVVSDARFGKLTSLPRLASITLNDTVGTRDLLDRLRSCKSLTSVTICDSSPFRGDKVTADIVDCIADLPHVSTVELLFSIDYHVDLSPLEGKESITNLALGYRADDRQGEVMPDDHAAILKTLPNLHSLSLYNCTLTDSTLEGLEEISSLKELDISMNSKQYATLREAMPNIVIHTQRVGR